VCDVKKKAKPCVSKVEVVPLNSQGKMSPKEGDKILMSQRQLQRWHLMGLVELGKITLKEEEKKIDVFCRQGRRIRRAGRQKGETELIHGNVDRSRPIRISSLQKKLSKKT